MVLLPTAKPGWVQGKLVHVGVPELVSQYCRREQVRLPHVGTAMHVPWPPSVPGSSVKPGRQAPHVAS